MPKGTPSLLYSAPCEAGFDAEKFLSLARSVFSNVSAGDGRIRSGRHIPRGFKNLVSSYKIIASHTPLMGGGRIDVAVVKLCPGAELTAEKEESVVRFVEACAASDGCGGVLACVPPAGERRGLVALAVSSSVKSVEVPRELMDFICAEGLKMYIHKSCGLSEAALDGYVADDRILFDDSLVRLHAAQIDEALASMRFCDVAASDGKIALAFVEKLAEARVKLNKYLGSAGRSAGRFAAEFVANGLCATDCSAAALDALRAALMLKYGAAPADGHFAWGSVLVDGVMDGEEFDLIISKPPHVRGEHFSSIKPLLGGYASSQFGADLYCYYVEKAAAMLSQGGSAVMLVSNKWMKSRYGEGLRRFFALRPPRMVADLGSAPQITGSAMPLCVLSFYKEAVHDEPVLVIEAEGAWNGLPRGRASVQPYVRGAEELGEAPWNFTEGDKKSLEEKIYEKSIPLASCAGGVYRGVLTGLNEAFVLDAAEAEEIAAKEPASAPMLVPVYTGREVKRYYLPQAKKRLIFMPKGIHRPPPRARRAGPLVRRRPPARRIAPRSVRAQGREAPRQGRLLVGAAPVQILRRFRARQDNPARHHEAPLRRGFRGRGLRQRQMLRHRGLRLVPARAAQLKAHGLRLPRALARAAQRIFRAAHLSPLCASGAPRQP